MNIFFLARIVEECALYHADVHVIKMILETAQLLYSSHHIFKTDFSKAEVKPFKMTHSNHPCAIWARESVANYIWLCRLGIALCKEYTFRYDKIHSCEENLMWLSKNIPPLSDKPFTDPPQTMPEEFKDLDCVKAYRQYYFNVKGDLKRFGYKKRSFPTWWNDIKMIRYVKTTKQNSTQCQGLTKKGLQCRLKTTETFCHLHKD